jgi:glycosyltransferase involved in cell wall biosynthesis
MRILLLTQYYSPEPVKYISDIAEMWLAQGHEVTVLTGFPNYPTGKLAPGYRLRMWRKEKINGVSVIRVPLYPDNGRSIIKRPANLLSFAVSAVLLGPWLAPRVDAIYVIQPPLTIGLPAQVLSLLKRVPYFFEIQDMWPEAFVSTGVLREGMIYRLMKWYSWRLFGGARALRVISPGFRSHLADRGIPAERIRVISNWVDTSLYTPAEPDPTLAEKLGMAGKFNFMFAGALGFTRKLDNIVEGAALLADVPQAQIVFVGDGNDLSRLKALAEERKLTNVKFLGRFPAHEMPGLYAIAQVLLVNLQDDPIFRITIPHKIFAYMASRKPILAAIAGDGADAIRESNAGLTCAPSNPAAFAEAARRMVAMKAEELAAMGENGYRTARNSYSRESLSPQITEMLLDSLGNR